MNPLFFQRQLSAGKMSLQIHPYDGLYAQERRPSVVVLRGIKHAPQLFDPKTEVISPFAVSSVVVNRAAPTFGSRLLDRRIAQLALYFDDQVIAILQLDYEVGQIFPGRTCAWDTLQRSLKSKFDESVWSHLAGTVSEPFALGERRRVAVKVIDERGNELMRVLDVVE
jgi:hypothetical protein